jgi:hypothetical protein
MDHRGGVYPADSPAWLPASPVTPPWLFLSVTRCAPFAVLVRLTRLFADLSRVSVRLTALTSLDIKAGACCASGFGCVCQGAGVRFQRYIDMVRRQMQYCLTVGTGEQLSSHKCMLELYHFHAHCPPAVQIVQCAASGAAHFGVQVCYL